MNISTEKLYFEISIVLVENQEFIKTMLQFFMSIY